MSEVNLVYQMYNTLSKSDKMRFMQMLGMPPQMTEIIDSSTMDINGYHSQLKTFMERFHGVATKYLNNYLVWHNLRNYAEGDFNFKESVWERHNAEAIYDDSKWTYMFRPPIPLPLAA